MLTSESITNTLLKYGFSWEEVEHYVREPKELNDLIKQIENS